MTRTSHKALILPSKLGKYIVGLAVIPHPGPSEVLVRIESAALNPVEWKIQTHGAYVDTYPAILGTAGAGTVEEVGSEVTTLGNSEGTPHMSHHHARDFRPGQTLVLTRNGDCPTRVTIDAHDHAVVEVAFAHDRWHHEHVVCHRLHHRRWYGCMLDH